MERGGGELLSSRSSLLRTVEKGEVILQENIKNTVNIFSFCFSYALCTVVMQLATKVFVFLNVQKANRLLRRGLLKHRNTVLTKKFSLAKLSPPPANFFSLKTSLPVLLYVGGGGAPHPTGV